MSDSPATEFRGKRALVTGGTKGMGEAIAERLRSSGATVVTTARSAPANLPEPGLFVRADISTPDGAEKVVSYVRDRLGGVDILVNNVGGSSAPGGGFAALTDEDWQAALSQNLLSNRAVGDAMGRMRCSRRKPRKRTATSRPHQGRGQGYVGSGRPCSSTQTGGATGRRVARAPCESLIAEGHGLEPAVL
jgi:NAD(P)-dependent dehydrogenase (short-subunit alcohol dehydrogenase family)